MRKTVLWHSPHVRASLSALLAFVAILAVAGCGGGGGGGGSTTGGGNNGSNNGGTPPGQDPSLPFLSGRVVDTSSPPNGVVGATIVLFAPGLPNIVAKVTSPDGSFTISNVPKAYTAFSVFTPDPQVYYNFALYGSNKYDTVQCRLPLPALQAGPNSLATNVVLYSASSTPPPPPLNGCP